MLLMIKNTEHINTIDLRGVKLFVILSYDINKKRVGKVLKICRKYLSPVHKSVFEGMITQKNLNDLKRELSKNIDCNTDSICIYIFETTKYSRKEQIGITENRCNII